MNKFKLFIIIFSFLFFLPRFFLVFSVYFAYNKVILYEEGKRITDSSVVNNTGHISDVCIKGVCNIGQQYESVIFYKTKQREVLRHDQWVDNWYLTRSGCEGFVKFKEDLVRAEIQDFERTKEYEEIDQKRRLIKTREEDDILIKELVAKRQAYMKQRFDFYDNPKCQINTNEYEKIYLKNLFDQALYSTRILLPGPTGGEGVKCFTQPCMPGGRIGNDRIINVDIKKGKIIESKEDYSSKVTNLKIKIFEMVVSFLQKLFGQEILFR